jgi:hypothetical protein
MVPRNLLGRIQSDFRDPKARPFSVNRDALVELTGIAHRTSRSRRRLNADGTTGLPMPTVIIADAAGVIRWIDVHRDYTIRTEPGQILQAITQTIA